MTIKDMQERTGISRANIRYYESEGLLHPERQDNGYRIYSEKDLLILLRIKLLRSLGVSLEHIKEVIEGVRTLSDIMEVQKLLLQQNSRDASIAEQICDRISRDGVDFNSLEPEKYTAIAEEGKTQLPKLYRDEADTEQPIGPWRRYFARILDLYIINSVVLAVFLLFFRGHTDMLSQVVNVCRAVGLDNLYTSYGIGIIRKILAVIVMFAVEPFILHLFGTTPGKWILGLYLEDENGAKPTIGASLRWTSGAVTQGMGLAIPCLDTILNIICYSRVKKGQILSWQCLVYRQRKLKKSRIILWIITNGILFSLSLCANNYISRSLPYTLLDTSAVSRVADYAESDEGERGLLDFDPDYAVYGTEEELIEHLEPGECAYVGNAFYVSIYSSLPGMRIVDTEGVIHSPVYEMAVTEEGEVIEDETTYDGEISYCGVFRFDLEFMTMDGTSVTAVVSAGLIYWVDDEGHVLYQPEEEYKFSYDAGNGTFYSGVGYGAEALREQENGKEFLESFWSWMNVIDKNGEIISKRKTEYMDTVIECSVLYPEYYALTVSSDNNLFCYTLPTGERSISVRKRSDGQYEIVDTREYYLDKDFLEDTVQYDEELLKEKAMGLSVNWSSSAVESLVSVMNWEWGDLNPVVDETVIYLTDMPEELKVMSEDLAELFFCD